VKLFSPLSSSANFTLGSPAALKKRFLFSSLSSNTKKVFGKTFFIPVNSHKEVFSHRTKTFIKTFYDYLVVALIGDVIMDFPPTETTPDYLSAVLRLSDIDIEVDGDR
jgi:hypothetical protein